MFQSLSDRTGSTSPMGDKFVLDGWSSPAAQPNQPIENKTKSYSGTVVAKERAGHLRPIYQPEIGVHMRASKSTTVIISSFLLVSTAAFAQQATPERVPDKTADMKSAIDAKFKQLDVNGDGFVSKDEAAKMRGLPERFDGSDANKDGKLDPAEFGRAMGA